MTTVEAKPKPMYPNVRYKDGIPANFYRPVAAGIQENMFERATFNFNEAEKARNENKYVTIKKNRKVTGGEGTPIYVIWSQDYADLRRAVFAQRVFRTVNFLSADQYRNLSRQQDFNLSVQGNKANFYSKPQKKSDSRTKAQKMVNDIIVAHKFKTLRLMERGFWKERGMGSKSRWICWGSKGTKEGYYWINHGITIDNGKKKRFRQAVPMSKETAEDAIKEYQKKRDLYDKNKAKYQEYFQKSRDALIEQKVKKVGYMIINKGVEMKVTFQPLPNVANQKDGRNGKAVTSTIHMYRAKKYSVYNNGGNLQVKIKGKNLDDTGFVNRPFKVPGNPNPFDRWMPIKTRREYFNLTSLNGLGQNDYQLYLSVNGVATKTQIGALASATTARGSK